MINDYKKPSLDNLSPWYKSTNNQLTVLISIW